MSQHTLTHQLKLVQRTDGIAFYTLACSCGWEAGASWSCMANAAGELFSDRDHEYEYFSERRGVHAWTACPCSSCDGRRFYCGDSLPVEIAA